MAFLQPEPEITPIREVTKAMMDTQEQQDRMDTTIRMMLTVV